jgi:uncharacterized protein (TIGR03435 family)
MKQLCAVVAAALTLVPWSSQAQDKFEFEVASVKPYSIQNDGSTPVTLGARIDGAQVRMTGMTMRDFLSTAYRVKVYQINGPDWIATERYDIAAKLPSGVSPEKLPEMTESLLKERFGLRMHREQKEMPVYVLTIGKPPLKLTEVIVDKNAPAPAASRSRTGAHEGLAVNMGNGSSYSLAAANSRRRKSTRRRPSECSSGSPIVR